MKFQKSDINYDIDRGWWMCSVKFKTNYTIGFIFNDYIGYANVYYVWEFPICVKI